MGWYNMAGAIIARWLKDCEHLESVPQLTEEQIDFLRREIETELRSVADGAELRGFMDGLHRGAV